MGFWNDKNRSYTWSINWCTDTTLEIRTDATLEIRTDATLDLRTDATPEFRTDAILDFELILYLILNWYYTWFELMLLLNYDLILHLICFTWPPEMLCSWTCVTGHEVLLFLVLAIVIMRPLAVVVLLSPLSSLDTLYTWSVPYCCCSFSLDHFQFFVALYSSLAKLLSLTYCHFGAVLCMHFPWAAIYSLSISLGWNVEMCGRHIIPIMARQRTHVFYTCVRCSHLEMTTVIKS